MTTVKKDIRSLSIEELQTQFVAAGFPAFKAKQAYEWLWKKGIRSFDEMTNLSLEMREWLNENYNILTVTVLTSQRSKDGTIKMAFKLHDDAIIEGVLIPTDSRMTACVSSQVGCSLSCSFCATGFLKRQRNLDAAEIYDQVWLIDQLAKKTYNMPLSNIVFMGMGEPLLNYSNVLEGIAKITGKDGLGMSPNRITVSTAGIAKMIKKLGDDGVRFNLALSLHAANNEKRSKIMPINDTNPIEDLIEALNYFYKKTKRKITLEYAVMNDTNDGNEEADELIKFAKKVPCKVNLIEYNPISLANFKSSETDKIQKFAERVESKGIIVNIRRSRGKDIDAACGQLANKH
ncbi:MAG: 23S rRNA (adenine(2503)-C(2))-methyltransferase RlmN [Bacteroidota bacterium]|nr:23S rRNA (adenine(2503)-C(2))-methyltransferase RlmN [Bacteroidota bacterium]